MGISIQIVPGLIPVDGETFYCGVSRADRRIYISAEAPPEKAADLIEEASRQLTPQIVFRQIPFVGDVA